MLAAAVVFAVGSAFTTAKADAPKVDKNGYANYVFVRVSGPANSTNAADYRYFTGNITCVSSSETCKANWSQTTAPAANSQPTGSFVSVKESGTPQL